MPEKAVRELLAPFGALKAFNLVMDRETGKSKVQYSNRLQMETSVVCRKEATHRKRD